MSIGGNTDYPHYSMAPLARGLSLVILLVVLPSWAQQSVPLHTLASVLVPPDRIAHCTRLTEAVAELSRRIGSGEDEIKVINDLEGRRVAGEASMSGLRQEDLLEVVAASRSAPGFKDDPSAVVKAMSRQCRLDYQRAILDAQPLAAPATWMSCTGPDALFACLPLTGGEHLLGDASLGLFDSGSLARGLWSSGRVRENSAGTAEQLLVETQDGSVVKQMILYRSLNLDGALAALTQAYGRSEEIRFDTGVVETVITGQTMRSHGTVHEWSTPATRVSLQITRGTRPDGSDIETFLLTRIPLKSEPQALASTP